MHIVINQSSNVFGVDAENKIFAQSTETVTFDVTFKDPQATLQGLYCALLSDGGKTLALTTISENKAILDTNTIECVEYVAQWAIGTTRHAFIVIGESTKPLAIVDVEVAQNPLEGLMPPTESAPSYPTSAELQAILAEITEKAKTASESAQSANQSAIFVNTAKDEVVRIGAQITTDKALIAGYASSASSSASRAEEAKRIAVNAVEVIGEMQDEIGATKTKIDATAKTVQANADAVADAKTEIATASTAINEAVGKAEQAKTDAVTAQVEASKSAEQASTSAENANKSAEQAEQAKNAIGDVGERLEAVETSVGTLTETVEANNNVAKFTAYPNFVQTVCDALTATKQYGTISHPANSYPVNVVYTMTNGWTIVAMEVPINTSYLCVFDADWALLWSAKRSGDVRFYYQRVCEEVNGVAYVFGAWGKATKTVMTITKGADGSVIVTNETEVAYADGVTSSANWNEIYAQAIGRYIVFADVIFDTQAMKIVANLSASIGNAWKYLVDGVFYANVGSIFTKFSLDADGNIVISDASSVDSTWLLSLTTSVFSTSYPITIKTQYRGGAPSALFGIKFGQPDATYGSRPLPCDVGYRMYAITPFKGVLVYKSKNNEIAIWDAINYLDANSRFAVRERVICPISLYKPRRVALNTNNEISDVKSIIHGMDSKGIWMSFGQKSGWTQLHTLQGKLIRVLWEDLK